VEKIRILLDIKLLVTSLPEMIFIPIEDLTFAPFCVITKWKEGILLDISLFLTFLLLD